MNNFSAKIFNGVYALLRKVAGFSDLSVDEVAVLLYFLVIPLTWAVWFDIWLELPLSTCLLLIVWLNIFVTKRGQFEFWCKGVASGWRRRLRSIDKVNYKTLAVALGVAAPMAIYAAGVALCTL